jgi:hypothetical protein
MLNDEFPSMYQPPNMYGYSRWLQLERWAARRADAIVVPSDDRQVALKLELGLKGDVPFITMRNTPEVALPLEEINWHLRVGIPSEKKIFIHAGSIADWAQVPELLGSVSYWPSDAVVLLHNSRGRDERYRQQLSHLDDPARVFWSYDKLPDKSINSLVSHCTGSFALYRNFGPNFEQIGTSSGKLMRSIVCKTPVIASKFKSTNFVSDAGVGQQVMHPAEIPAAVRNLIENIDSYRLRCELFATAEKTRREDAWDRIVQCVQSSSKYRQGLPSLARK